MAASAKRWAWLAFAGLLALTGTAIAQPGGAAGAEGEPSPQKQAAALALFDEGRQLMREKRYAEACPKLEQSYQLFPGTGTLFNLSDCYEQLGRTASAWTGFREVAAKSQADGRVRREKEARQRVAALEPRLSRLVVAVGEPVEGLRVTREGEAIDRLLWGQALPMDPGSYTIAATAPGKQRWEKLVRVQGQGATVRVEIPELDDAQPPEPTGPGPTPSAAPVTPPTQGPSEAPPSTLPAGAERPWQMPLGVTLLGVGVAGMGTSIALGLLAKSKADDADCNPDGTCSPDGLDDRDAAVTQAHIGTAVFFGGAALAAVGTVLWLTAPSEPTGQAVEEPEPTAAVGLGPSGLVLRGQF